MALSEKAGGKMSLLEIDSFCLLPAIPLAGPQEIIGGSPRCMLYDLISDLYIKRFVASLVAL
jgi:hypothetical protein